MTKHNATWSEEQYYQDDELDVEDEDVDPRSNQHGKRGYWDYNDE
jgi:hypothetical protein